MPQIKNNHILALDFFKILYREEDPKVTIQCHYELNSKVDKEGFDRLKKNNPTKIWYDNYSNLTNKIDKMSEKGYGIFFLVNHSGAAATKKTDVKYGRHFFIDIDNKDLPTFSLYPTIILERERKNFHCYWNTEKITDRYEWEFLQKNIINYYKADKACKNFNRLLRVPGTQHHKEGFGQDGYRIYDMYEHNEAYITNCTIDEIKEAHNIEYEVAIETIKDISANQDFLNLNDNIKKQIDIRTKGNIPSGERNPTLFKVCAYLKDLFGSDKKNKKEVKKYMAYAASHCDMPLSDHEVDTIFDNVYKYTESSVNFLAKELRTNWVYISPQDRYLNKRTPRIDYPEKSFNNVMKAKGFFNASIIAHYGFIEDVHNRGYLPHGPEIYNYEGEKRFNIYTPTSIEPIEKHPKWFIELLDHMLEKEEKEHFLNYFAHIMQHPDKKIAHGIILQSDVQGIGKTLLYKILNLCVGESNCGQPTNKQVNEQYNTWLEGKVLIYIDEIDQGHKAEFYNDMKSYITDSKVSIRRMRTDPYIVGNFANFFCTTNNDHMIKLDNNDRRWYIVKSKAKKMSPEKIKEFFQPKWDRVNANQVGDVLHFLQTRDLSCFKAGNPAPMTRAKQEVIEDSRSKLEKWIADSLEDQVQEFGKLIIIISKDVLPNIPHYINSKYTSDRVIGSALRIAGCEQRVKKIEGKTKRFWVTNAEKWDLMDNEEQLKQFKKDQPVSDNNGFNSLDPFKSEH